MTIEQLEAVISDDKLRMIMEHDFKYLEVGEAAQMEFLGSDGKMYTIHFSRSK